MLKLKVGDVIGKPGSRYRWRVTKIDTLGNVSLLCLNDGEPAMQTYDPRGLYGGGYRVELGCLLEADDGAQAG